jgi:glycosyltransferase involved in cell wall biosynthesis
MPARYHEVDVLALPSLTRSNWKEQFGRVLVEAMASGVPVIGSNSGAIPGVIEDAGFVVPEGEAAALAAALERMRADSTLYADFSRKGRDRAVTHFTHARVAEATVRVYEDMLASFTPAPDARSIRLEERNPPERG